MKADYIKLYKKDIKGKYKLKVKKGSLPIEKSCHCGCGCGQECGVHNL